MFFGGNEKEEKIEELEDRVDKLKEEKESLRKRFEKSDEKRSELARKKQEAEERINKLEDKLQSVQSKDDTRNSRNRRNWRMCGFEDVKSYITSLSTYSNDRESVVSFYKRTGFSETEKGYFDDLSSKELNRSDSVICFFDEPLISVFLKSRVFFKHRFNVGSEFDVKPLEKFIEKNKTWVVLKAGDSMIIEEENGEIISVENIKDRINRQHSKGGFSQKRFERKREEQIEEHLNRVQSKLEDLINEEILLVGEEELCSKIDYNYLGGFDNNRDMVDALYNFRIKRV